MHSRRSSLWLSLVYFLLTIVCSLYVPAQAAPANTSRQDSPGRSEIEISSGELHEQVIALRENVLRVRMWRGDSRPEDASWAVLSSARRSTVAATRATEKDHINLRTTALIAEVDKSTLELTVSDLSGNVIQKDARPITYFGDSFRLYKTMPLDEHYFGLGDKTGPLDRRNEAFTLWNTDAYRFQESTDPLYKSIPYFMTYRAGRATGVLMDNTWRSSFDFGKESSDVYSFGAAAGPVDYYVIYGPTPKKVVQTYAWLTGTPPLPPLWAFGFQQSRYSYMSQARVLEVAKRLRDDRIPSDAIYLDIDLQVKNRPFTINRTAFPDFPGMVGQLRDMHLHTVAITDLHIANLPGQGYAPFDTGIAGSHFIKNPDGSVYSGLVWPGPSVFPDFTRQQTRAWWGALYRPLRSNGVDGFWNDMNEPSIFDTPTHTAPENVVHRIDEPGFRSRTATHAEIHNVYGMENSRATFEGLLNLDPDTRPFVLTRATYAGGQRYAATWTGDNSSNWNHLRLTNPMIENLGLSGFAYTGADVGGYAGTPMPELLTKWFEVGAFQPIYRDHTEKGTGDQEPWVGGPEHEEIRRSFIEARYRLMPYLYTLAEESSRTGMPMQRPLFLEFPDAAADHHPLDMDFAAGAEFMLGPNLLVAPNPYPDEQDAYTVEFPSPGWYDYWTGEQVTGNNASSNVAPEVPGRVSALPSIQVQSSLAALPVFVRPGSILPIAPLVQSTSETPAGPLTLKVYAAESCSGELYQDDGKTYAYQRGVYLRMNFACHQSSNGMQISIGAHEGSYPAWWKDIRVELYGSSPSKDTVIGDSKASSVPIERSQHSVSLTVPDSGRGFTIELR